jgi:UDP-galactopyranose mutase
VATTGSVAVIAVAGAGFSGAVVARQLAEAGLPVHVYEPRDHVAGNCHTERHPTGVLVHRYGPHIFHTASSRVWDHVCRFATFRRYEHRVFATVGGRVFSLPVNLLTINQFFGTALSPAEARDFVAARAAPGDPDAATTFTERAHRTIGTELYEAFFAGYTRKQWGRAPEELPASVFSRLPVRFDYDDSYFDHPYQGMPENGYTALVEAMLDHPRITVDLGTPFPLTDVSSFDHTFWTGPLDAFFGFERGRLSYRTLDFEVSVHDGDHQGCAVMNHCDPDVPHTRVTEFAHLAPWEHHERSVVFTEFPRAAGPDDIPYYPVRLADPTERLSGYLAEARRTVGVTFLGRLGTYRYLDMDRAVLEALETADRYLDCRSTGRPPLPFTVDVGG